jgi:hypothetical protein
MQENAVELLTTAEAADYLRLKERTVDRDQDISLKGFRTQLKAIQKSGRSAPSDLARITQPTLIANGDNDRMVPSLGLDRQGTLTLDYGPRRFTIGLDDRLKPYVTDQTGARLRALPRPAVGDDEDRARAAYQRFKDLKAEVDRVAAEQIVRWEAAMRGQRRWRVRKAGRHQANA